MVNMVARVSASLLYGFENYKLADMDTGGAIEYYGYLTPKGDWYIMRLTSTAARFVKGDRGTYITNWVNRASVTYDYFDEVF